MFFKIDPHNGVPVYEQVVRQITFAVAGGAIRPGEMIPSVRQLAKTLAINPNTVARAYRQLQESEVVESIRGTGMQIAQDAKKKCLADRKSIICTRIKTVVREARQSQLSDDELRSIFSDALANQAESQA